MIEILPKTNIDFIGKRNIAFIFPHCSFSAGYRNDSDRSRQGNMGIDLPAAPLSS